MTRIRLGSTPSSSTATCERNGVDPLAHLGPAVSDLDEVVAPEMHDCSGDLLEPVAKPGVLQPEAQTHREAGSPGLVVGGLHCVEAGSGSEAAVVHDLSGTPDRTGFDDVAIADVPATDAYCVGQAIEDAFHRELRLVGSEPAEGAADRVVGAGRDRFDVDVGHDVGAGCVTGCSFQDLHADRRVRAGVAEHPDSQGSQPAFGITTGLVGHANGMTFGVDEERFFARERGADRSLQQPGSQRGLGLIRQVFLAAEGSAVADQFGHDGFGRNVQHSGNVVAVVPDALSSRVDQQSIEIDGLAARMATGEGKRLPCVNGQRQR